MSYKQRSCKWNQTVHSSHILQLPRNQDVSKTINTNQIIMNDQNSWHNRFIKVALRNKKMPLVYHTIPTIFSTYLNQSNPLLRKNLTIVTTEFNLDCHHDSWAAPNDAVNYKNNITITRKMVSVGHCLLEKCDKMNLVKYLGDNVISEMIDKKIFQIVYIFQVVCFWSRQVLTYWNMELERSTSNEEI